MEAERQAFLPFFLSAWQALPVAAIKNKSTESMTHLNYLESVSRQVTLPFFYESLTIHRAIDGEHGKKDDKDT